MKVGFEDGEEDTIRLLRIDTPETIANNEDPDIYDKILILSMAVTGC